MKYPTFTMLIAVFLTLGLAGCASDSQRLPKESDYGTGPAVLTESYRISVGDQVQINVWKNPELSISEPVRPDGKVSLALVGDVMAAGRTPAELSADIERKLTDYVKNPNATVILTNLQGNAFLSRVRVTGAVQRNMSMPYHQGMTVLDAILEAGSVDIYANPNQTKLHRRSDKGTTTYDIRLKDILEDGDMTSNVRLMPGDILTVPERSF